jgi:phosphotransferase system HPr (HPr) family protein
MIDTEIEIINKLGLHARAAAKLVGVTAQFQAKILLGRGDKLVDAKSIMPLLLLGAPKTSVLRLTIDGVDEQQAHAAIAALVLNRFDESE